MSIKDKGFTLIELMVSITIFSVVMLASMGAVLTVLNANRKSESLRSVMDNLSFTLDTMTRTIRFGSVYHCSASGNLSVPNDCPSGDSSLTVLDSSNNQVTFYLSSGQIMRVVGTDSPLSLTSPDVNIQTLGFWVVGSTPYSAGGDLLQPKVIVLIKGYVAGTNMTGSSFTLQTTISQRKLDL
jgi:prepilin-type N-terminal cleavage/methylation domain-containing protein